MGVFCVLHSTSDNTLSYFNVPIESAMRRELSKECSPEYIISNSPYEDTARRVLSGISTVTDKIASLPAYLLRCKLSGLPCVFANFIECASLNLLSMSYEQLITLPSVLSRSKGLDAIECYDRILVDTLISDLLSLKETSYLMSYAYRDNALFYNFEKGTWVLIGKGFNNLLLQWSTLSGSVNQVEVSEVSGYKGVTMSSILSSMGLKLEDNPKFFRVDGFFPIALQVFLRNPQNLQHLSNSVFLDNKERQSKTGRKSIGFFTLNLDVVDDALRAQKPYQALGSFGWGLARKNWRDEFLQSKIEKYLI